MESRAWLLRDTRAAHKKGARELARLQGARLVAMVAFARASSPYYRRLYRELPYPVTDPAVLPVTSKTTLMAEFDDWVTDRTVTLPAARAFVDDPSRVGEKLAGRYTVATTSGTTGTRGIFLMDERSLRVTSALTARMLSAWLTAHDAWGIAARGGRIAMVNATGGHYASATAGAALRRNRLARSRIGVFGVHTPMPQLVAALNRFQPAILAPYASMGALLAAEQLAGRLRIDPVLVVLSAEGLAATEQATISAAFGAKVHQSYAATECPFLSYSCAHGWLHINSDWVLLEPVDADHRPVPPGQPSHTTLLTNLANQVQPILRYDLGDVAVANPERCPCGDPLPALRVQGRAGDLLAFPTPAGHTATLAPLVFTALLDRIPGIAQFQVVHTACTTVEVRLQPELGTDANQIQHRVITEVRELLSTHNLDHVTVTVTVTDKQPQRTVGGKLRTVIPLSSGR